MIRKELFDNYCGEDVFLYVLEGDGVEVGITDFGAAIQYFLVKTATGVKDIVLGYPTIKDRVDSGTYCGAVIGRTANRIRNSQFVLDGKTFYVSSNDGKNCNHGGKEGFDKRLFKASVKGNVLELVLSSHDGDQGYPGNLVLKVEYELKGKTLRVRFLSECDKNTLWAPTCHPYFNLNGESCGTLGGTVLKINADNMTPTDGENVVTGDIVSADGTSFDFTSFKSLEDRIAETGGYDINYILRDGCAASAYCRASDIRLDIYTDLPGLQLYTGNFLQGRGKSREYSPHDGFCLEPQYVPNAVNTGKFLSPLLEANTKKEHFIEYEISV